MLFQEAPADTVNFMIIGFVVILGTIGLFMLSLYTRYRNLERDRELLDQLEAGEAERGPQEGAIPSATARS